MGVLAIWTRFIEELKLNSNLSCGGFLDDGNFRTSHTDPLQAVADLSIAWDRSQRFDSLTGTLTNLSKTLCFATTKSAELEMKRVFCSNESPITFCNSFKLVGGQITAKGKPNVQLRNNRFRTCVRRLKKVRFVPLPFIQKAHIMKTACIPTALVGTEFLALTIRQCYSLRCIVLKSLFQGHYWCRNPAATLTFILPGHLLDPKQAMTYHVLRNLRRLFARRPDLRALFRTTWLTAAQHSAEFKTGLFKNIQLLCHRLGWTWTEPFLFTLPNATSMKWLEDDTQVWLHNLRVNIRKLVWQEPEFMSRKDMHGATSIHYKATTKLIRLNMPLFNNHRTGFRKSKLTAMQVTHLRSILSGAIYTQERLFLAGYADTKDCPYCHTDVLRPPNTFFGTALNGTIAAKRFTSIFLRNSSKTCQHVHDVVPLLLKTLNSPMMILLASVHSFKKLLLVL